MELFTDILVHIIVPLLALFFLTIVTILLLNRAIYEVYRFRIRVARAKIDVFLTALVFAEYDEQRFKADIALFKRRIPFRKNWCKDIILHEIISLKQNLKGEVTRHIDTIYEEFNLYKYSLHFLKSSRWYVKSTGIYHFQALEYEKAEPYVRKYISSKNRKLSANAYMALVSLNTHSLDFLSRFRTPISLTNEIKIMDILHTKKTPEPTNLKDWIHSPNPSIVRLGLRLMVFYNHNSESERILELLDSHDKSVRTEVIVTARELFITGSETSLIAHFTSESLSNKLEILKTLSVIGTERSQDFLADLLTKPYRTEVKLQAVYTLEKINPLFFDAAFTDDEQVQKMVQHVKDPYI